MLYFENTQVFVSLQLFDKSRFF